MAPLSLFFYPVICRGFFSLFHPIHSQSESLHDINIRSFYLSRTATLGHADTHAHTRLQTDTDKPHTDTHSVSSLTVSGFCDDLLPFTISLHSSHFLGTAACLPSCVSLHRRIFCHSFSVFSSDAAAPLAVTTTVRTPFSPSLGNVRIIVHKRGEFIRVFLMICRYLS